MSSVPGTCSHAHFVSASECLTMSLREMIALTGRRSFAKFCASRILFLSRSASTVQR